MWREGLLIKLEKMGIKSRLYNWVLDFLSDRTFKVRVGDAISEEYSILNGIPQGSSISPILFNIMINDIFVDIGRGTGSSLYADDGAIWNRSRNINHATRVIQGTIDKVEEWSYNWGFKMAVSKTCYMIITKKRKLGNVKLRIYGQEIERVKEFKYLGVWIDEKCRWKTHISKVETKCKKVLNLMRAVSGYDWGADKQSLLGICLDPIMYRLVAPVKHKTPSPKIPCPWLNEKMASFRRACRKVALVEIH